MSNFKTKCPYCASNNILLLDKVTETVMPRSMQESRGYKNKLITLEPMLCKDCHIGFNAVDLDEETRRQCFEMYEFIKPSSGIGASRFRPFLQLILDNSKKDDNLLEIGCYDGFILNELNKLGYKSLYGYDPSALIESREGITIVKDFFTNDTKIDFELNGVILGCLIGVIDNLDAFFSMLHKKLSPHGRIYIETPDVTGVHAVQIWRFCMDFFDRLAKNNMFKVIASDTYSDEAILSHEHYRLILEKIDKESEYKEFFLKEDKYRIFKTSLQALKMGTLNSSFIDECKQLVIENNKEQKETLLYGGGTTTFKILEILGEDLFVNSKFVILDSDKSREGALFTTPFNTTIKVHYANDYLKEHNVDNIIIAVISKFFIKEIVDNIKSLQPNLKDFVINKI